MNPLFTYAAPPLIGAFIGYMTNYVAIRMLFRPLKPWRLLGIRIPMTPGVIPSRRHQLAENIGEMVGEHLLTSGDVRKALQDEGFRRELRELVTSRISAVLTKELGPVESLIPARFTGYFQTGVKILRWRLLKHLHTHLENETFAATVSSSFAEQLESFLSRTGEECLGVEDRVHLGAFMEGAIGRFLAGNSVESWLQNTLREKTAEIIATDKSVADLLPEELCQSLLDLLDAEAPQLLSKFAAMLQEPAMRDKIATTLAGAIGGFAASLGPMAAMLGNFLDPETIRVKIRDYLEEKGDTLAEGLFDQAAQKQIAAALRGKAEQLLTSPLSGLLAKTKPETLESWQNEIAAQLLQILRTPATATTLARLLQEGLSAQLEQPLRDTMITLFGVDGLEKGKEWATGELLATLRSTKNKRLIDSLVTELLEKKLLTQPIGTLADFLPKAVQESMGDYLLQLIGDLLVREVPGLVDALNIRSIVARKVDSLNLLRLEELLLSIMQEQFKYINLFGGLLGFLIGLANLAFLATF